MKIHSLFLTLAALAGGTDGAYQSEFKHMEGHTLMQDYVLPMPHEYLGDSKLPANFNWANVNGTSYLTRMLNQHVPQYCGSCWAHGAISALGDRVKIMKSKGGEIGPDVHLSIQFILNCATEVAGSCHGGTATGVYEFIKHHAKDRNVPFDTCQPYLACSKESTEGFCGSIADKLQCTPESTCLTCNTFSGFPMKGKCKAIEKYPNCTISEYGTLPNDAQAIKAEIYARGPVPAGVNAEALLKYDGAVLDEKYCIDGNFDDGVNHIVSIVGWKTCPKTKKQHWIVRNSWGTYWGDMGFFYLEMGKNLLGIESEVSWATPGQCTATNFPCDEDGDNCGPDVHQYVDPSMDLEALERRLSLDLDLEDESV